MDDWKSNPALFDVLDQDTIADYALSFAKANAVEDARLFMQTLGSDRQRRANPQNLNAFVHALLSNDHAELAWSCLHKSDTTQWCDRNTHYLVHRCPQVFERWVEPHWMRLVIQCMDTLVPMQKEALLRGEGVTKAQMHVHQALQGNSQLWWHFSPRWLGEEHSPLRQLAIELGWTRSMIPRMLRNGQYRGLSDWNHVIDHPYSCYVLGIFERFSNGNASSMDSKTYLGAIISKFSDDTKTHSEDAALMKLLLSEFCTHHPQFKYDKYVHHNAAVPHVTDQRWEELRAMVRTYLALDNLSGLLEELIHNRLRQTAPIEHLELPIMDSNAPS